MNNKKVISSSNYFDATWYKQKYHINHNQAEHYLNEGWKLGYDPSTKFCTSRYLKQNPDVVNAQMNPLVHYELHGKKEGRLLTKFDRFELITHRCNLKGKGLEIGPSFNPICPKSKGYDIEILDHMNQEDLKNKYKNHSNVVNLVNNIEPVDYVWHGEDYRDLIGQKKRYDYILASHLIEHTTDFIGFLEQCCDLLKNNGVLSLVVPNKYFSFDFFRENTSLAQVIDKHIGSNKSKHSLGGIIECYARHCRLDEKISWNSQISTTTKNYSLIFSKKQVQTIAKDDNFVDIHEWVFTPGSFRILINDLWELGYISLYEDFFHYEDQENTCEFYMTLKKKKKDSREEFNQQKRMELNKYKIQEEMEFYKKINW